MFLEIVFMKKCLKCGVEYQDNDMFCPVCGEKLTATNVCQRCGKPVSAEETYCRHCGYKIEKEIKCEQCGANIEEGAKFCPQCGAKVENPVVIVKEKQVKDKTSSASEVAMNPVLKKVFFYVFGGALLLLLSLMFIGCFGDIVKASYSGARISSSIFTNNQGISYFFGDAAKSIEQARQYDDQSLANFLTAMFVFEILLWLSAIALFVVGIVLGAINLAKGVNNEYKLKTKPFVYGLLGGLPYLFIFALKYLLSTKYRDSSTTYNLEQVFGWGTQMILVCTIIGVVTLVAYNILTAVFEKKDIVKQAIRGGVAISLTIALMTTLGLVVMVVEKESDTLAEMTLSPYSLYVSLLSSSCQSGQKMPDYAPLLLISYFLTIFGYGFTQAVINNILNERKSYAPITINAIFASILLIAGSAFGVEALKQSVNDSYSGSTNPYSIYVGAGCIVITLFVIIAVVGFIISDKVGKKKQEPQIQQ